MQSVLMELHWLYHRHLSRCHHCLFLSPPRQRYINLGDNCLGRRTAGGSFWRGGTDEKCLGNCHLWKWAQRWTGGWPSRPGTHLGLQVQPIPVRGRVVPLVLGGVALCEVDLKKQTSARFCCIFRAKIADDSVDCYRLRLGHRVNPCTFA
jgi:hypothetical protein